VARATSGPTLSKEMQFDIDRVRIDKYRSGIITIVPVRTGKLQKIPETLKKTGNIPTKHFVQYKLEKVNFLTYNNTNNNINSMVNNSGESQTFFN